jgi:hypothetical protein
MVTEYRLDELGWFQFERLCQSLLKAKYGAAVEAWSGNKDFGRDAYAPGPLRFPGKDSVEGPFVFQAKFVSGANAAGAKSDALLKDAVTREIKRVDKRIDSSEWDPPAVYCLMTNAPVSASLRKELVEALGAIECEVIVIMDGRDICIELDDLPNLRMSYPQILGLADLQMLIGNAVARDLITQSNITLKMLTSLASVFVATSPYVTALSILNLHHFVILTGPPEMGKTTIARMIALARHTTGWDVFDCRGPNDVFKVYDADRPQVFVADDAFGSTEYRPEVAANWAEQMDRVLAVCDATHWVIWTSRPAPLKTGLARLQIRGVGNQFPATNEVVVESDRLSLQEKAQILYRHAKAAGLSEGARNLVRSQALAIVQSPHFTPLRISRLIRTQMPLIDELPPDERLPAIRKAVAAGLAEATDEMTKSFDNLPDEPRSVLIALLDTPGGATRLADLADRIRELNNGELSESAEASAELVEHHFLRLDLLDV